MTILSPSNLETANYNQPEWVAIYNANVDRLNAVLLKINSLFDVDVDQLEDGAVLQWDTTDSKFKLVTF